MISNIYYSIKYGIKNLIKWFSVIWKDRDWDYEFLLIILEYKITSMEKFYSSEKVWGKDEDVITQLKFCKELLKRIRDDQYTEEQLVSVEEKYGELLPIMTRDEQGRLCMSFSYSEEEENARAGAYREAERLKQNDIHLLFNTIRDNFLSWWD